MLLCCFFSFSEEKPISEAWHLLRLLRFYLPITCVLFCNNLVWLQRVKHLYHQKKELLIGVWYILNKCHISFHNFLLLSCLFIWLFPNNVSYNRMLSRSLAIVFEWNRVITFSGVCTIRPYPCVGHCWMRILSDDYSGELITSNLAQQVNFWLDGKAVNFIFGLGKNILLKLRGSIAVKLFYVFAAISVLK